MGTVYRASKRDAHGDPVDQHGNAVRLSGDGAKLGTIDGMIIGARTSDTLAVRGDVVSTAGLIGWPASSEISPQAGDVVELDGQRFAITGPTIWGRPHSLTGSPARYCWITASAN
ncbi:hypothetical protein H7J06_22110 [Mycobacterium hodleri]|nr:hypothetical protein [Mycolicibacterium hodleri]